MESGIRPFNRFTAAVLIVVLSLCLMACSSESTLLKACSDGDRDLSVGFYAYFAPVSHSADEDPSSDGFQTHAGYEADLLSALETMKDARLSFSRTPIEPWEDIWLRPAGDEYDIVGGGITILDSRTMNPAGERVVAFTSGHIAFRQSLLVRSEDADRIRTHADLTSGDRVGALPDTTGEARLLQIVGLANEDGVLAAGTRVETLSGELVADGSADYAITSARETPNLDERTRLYPPDPNMPQVIYLGDELGEIELLDALESGRIDAVARGEIGNRDAESAFGGRFAVTALDDEIEYGGFTLSIQDAELRNCIDDRINFLTNDRALGYAEWLSGLAGIHASRSGLERREPIGSSAILINHCSHPVKPLWRCVTMGRRQNKST